MDIHDGLHLARRLEALLRQRGYPVERVLLFGSVARGEAHAGSDVDLAVVCRPFGPSRSEENGEFLWLAKDIDHRIETICLHPEDLTDNYSTLAREVARDGIAV